MKITFMSDTHGKEPKLPGGDILIHTGDLTIHGFRSEVIKQLNYLHEQLDKYKFIIVIPGNHDFWAERHLDQFRNACKAGELITLINESIEVMGIKFLGSPATPTHHNWAFNFNQESIKKIWESIPSSTEVLLTHGPPCSILDKTVLGTNAGCIHLFDTVQKLKPKIHAFGHIHEAAGVGENDSTLFVNAASAIINVTIENNLLTYELIKEDI